MTHTSRARRSEAGFTLLELIVVLIIVSVLVIAAWLALRSAQVSARNDAMKTAAASIDTAVGSYNRMYPWVGPISDPLLRLQNGMTGNTSQTSGLVDETGAWILAEWPKSPFANTGVTLNRYASPAPCTQVGQPGEVRVCRLRGTGQEQAYRVAAFGRNRSGGAMLVYSATHGAR